jgi:hypothetical protein
MQTLAVGVLCLALGIWLGRRWADRAIARLLDRLDAERGGAWRDRDGVDRLRALAVRQAAGRNREGVEA